MKLIIALFFLSSTIQTVQAGLIINMSSPATNCTVTPWPATDPPTLPCSYVGGVAGHNAASVNAALNFYNYGTGPIATFETGAQVDADPAPYSGAMSISFNMPAQTVSEQIIITGYTGTGFISLADMYEHDDWFYPDNGPGLASVTFNGCNPSGDNQCPFIFGLPIKVTMTTPAYVVNYPNCGLCDDEGAAGSSGEGSLHVSIPGTLGWVQSGLTVTELPGPVSAGLTVTDLLLDPVSAPEPSTGLTLLGSGAILLRRRRQAASRS